jgi:hypothetical protein
MSSNVYVFTTDQGTLFRVDANNLYSAIERVEAYGYRSGEHMLVGSSHLLRMTLCWRNRCESGLLNLPSPLIDPVRFEDWHFAIADARRKSSHVVIQRGVSPRSFGKGRRVHPKVVGS